MQVFHTKMGKPFLYVLGFVQGGIVMLKQGSEKYSYIVGSIL